MFSKDTICLVCGTTAYGYTLIDTDLFGSCSQSMDFPSHWVQIPFSVFECNVGSWLIHVLWYGTLSVDVTLFFERLGIMFMFRVIACVIWMGSDVCHAVCNLCLSRKRLILQTKPRTPIKYWVPIFDSFSDLKIGVTSFSAAEHSESRCGLNWGTKSWKQMSHCFVTWLWKWDSHLDSATVF